MVEREKITGLILAGGQGLRMGGVDKGLVAYRGRPLIEHAIERLESQVGPLLISANRNRETYARYGFPVLADDFPSYAGPLAGIVTALAACPTPWLAVVACDAPFFPLDLVARLAKAATEAESRLAVVRTASGWQPTFLVLHREHEAALRNALHAGERSIARWCAQQGAAPVFFEEEGAFANLNRPADLVPPPLPARLFAGAVSRLPMGEPSGIVKTALSTAVRLDREGIVGDVQADTRVHGGPEKALHQYPPAHYGRLATVFPECAERLVPGSLGENLSVPEWEETTVCIGDVFALGKARIQVCQPRSPCWKIDARLGQDGVMRHIAEQGMTGWYYRVLEPAVVASGDLFMLLERPAPEATLARLWRLFRSPRPPAEALSRFAANPFLSAAWREKLRRRLAEVSAA